MAREGQPPEGQLFSDDSPGAEKHVVVRQYGLLDPLNWGPDCQDHLFFATRLWNRLVEIEQVNRAKYRAILGTVEIVSDQEKLLADLNARLVEFVQVRKQARLDHRDRGKIHIQDHDEAIKQLKTQRQELGVLAKETRRMVREQVKPRLEELEQERREEVKRARQESKLWWGNYNAVVQSYQAARSRALAEGTELRFHRFDGSGRFSTQVHRGDTTEALLSGRITEVSLRVIDQEEFRQLTGRGLRTQTPSPDSRRSRRQYGILTMTVYTVMSENGRFWRTLDFPIILHRPLPVEGLLKTVVVNRRRVGSGFQWSATFTYTQQRDPILPSNNPHACGVHISCKQVPGGLRIATLFDARRPARHVVLPQVVLDTMGHVNVLQSRIDLATNEAFAWVKANLEPLAEDLPVVLADRLEAMKRVGKPHPEPFFCLVKVWDQLVPPVHPDLAAEAHRRRKEIKKHALECENLRGKVRRRRLDLYRNIGKTLAEEYGTIVLEKLNRRSPRRSKGASGAGADQVVIARMYQDWAAAGLFREWVEKQCAKTGSRIVFKEMPSATTHAACGAVVHPEGRAISDCGNCGESFDNDENAAAILLLGIEK